jgi:hypothetical protein
MHTRSWRHGRARVSNYRFTVQARVASVSAASPVDLRESIVFLEFLAKVLFHRNLNHLKHFGF